ncbi:hypothetical protein FGB62_305g06 [Gracilaria domingensis]|nr:hypothetical protein FGB62_305g06 [Gracilaria domingensis]
MNATQPIRFYPRASLSTIQFENDTLNNIAAGIITTVIISSLGSIINRLVALSKRDVFSFNSFTRAFLFNNSDDPLLIWSWLRGRYDFRGNDGSHTSLKVEYKLLIAPLAARCTILVISIGSIALALPSEKSLDACSGGDYTVHLEPPTTVTSGSRLSLFEHCPPLKLESSVGKVRSSLSLCSFYFPSVDSQSEYEIVQFMESEGIPGAIAASYDTQTGIVISTLYSGKEIILMGMMVHWRLSNGDILHSLFADYNSTLHLSVLADGISHAVNSSCEIKQAVFPDSDGDDSRSFGTLDCSFVPEDMAGQVVSALTSSIRFRKQDDIAQPVLKYSATSSVKERICGTEVTISSPLVNIVPLLIAAVISFTLNKIIKIVLSSREDVTHLGFHIVRELLGHDTSANPLQKDKAQQADDRVNMRRYICADGMSAHVGFVEGDGDVESCASVVVMFGVVIRHTS